MDEEAVQAGSGQPRQCPAGRGRDPETPHGAHFTSAAPDYGRDERFQRHYAEAAGSEESWAEFVSTYLSGSEADYQAAVRKFAEEQGAVK